MVTTDFTDGTDGNSGGRGAAVIDAPLQRGEAETGYHERNEGGGGSAGEIRSRITIMIKGNEGVITDFTDGSGGLGRGALGVGSRRSYSSKNWIVDPTAAWFPR